MTSPNWRITQCGYFVFVNHYEKQRVAKILARKFLKGDYSTAQQVDAHVGRVVDFVSTTVVGARRREDVKIDRSTLEVGHGQAAQLIQITRLIAKRICIRIKYLFKKIVYIDFKQIRYVCLMDKNYFLILVSWLGNPDCTGSNSTWASAERTSPRPCANCSH